jgi:hypothetical protein
MQGINIKGAVLLNEYGGNTQGASCGHAAHSGTRIIYSLTDRVRPLETLTLIGIIISR